MSILTPTQLRLAGTMQAKMAGTSKVNIHMRATANAVHHLFVTCGNVQRSVEGAAKDGGKTTHWAYPTVRVYASSSGAWGNGGLLHLIPTRSPISGGDVWNGQGTNRRRQDCRIETRRLGLGLSWFRLGLPNGASVHNLNEKKERGRCVSSLERRGNTESCS